jgi:hypothetical protein
VSRLDARQKAQRTSIRPRVCERSVSNQARSLQQLISQRGQHDSQRETSREWPPESEKKHAHKPPWLSTERRANADLAASLCGGKCGHAVNANHREESGQGQRRLMFATSYLTYR